MNMDRSFVAGRNLFLTFTQTSILFYKINKKSEFWLSIS